MFSWQRYKFHLEAQNIQVKFILTPVSKAMIANLRECTAEMFTLL